MKLFKREPKPRHLCHWHTSVEWHPIVVAENGRWLIYKMGHEPWFPTRRILGNIPDESYKIRHNPRTGVTLPYQGRHRAPEVVSHEQPAPGLVGVAS
jgi:hypothetical protein